MEGNKPKNIFHDQAEMAARKDKRAVKIARTCIGIMTAVTFLAVMTMDSPDLPKIAFTLCYTCLFVLSFNKTYVSFILAGILMSSVFIYDVVKASYLGEYDIEDFYIIAPLMLTMLGMIYLIFRGAIASKK